MPTCGTGFLHHRPGRGDLRHAGGQELQKKWGVPEEFEARCFVLLGSCKGDYPAEKPRKPGRSVIVED